MPVASSQRKRFADGIIASSGVRGQRLWLASLLGWNFHRETFSDSPTVCSTCIYLRSSWERRQDLAHLVSGPRINA